MSTFEIFLNEHQTVIYVSKNNINTAVKRILLNYPSTNTVNIRSRRAGDVFYFNRVAAGVKLKDLQKILLAYIKKQERV